MGSAITSRRNGNVIYSSAVADDCDILPVTEKGTVLRTSVKNIKISGRNTQGVTLMRTEDRIISVAIAPAGGDEDYGQNDRSDSRV